jgi:nucleotide-binding universal stress UspA family protein
VIVCALEEGQQSSAAAGCTAWLSESLSMPLRLEGAAGDDLIAATHSEARLLVVGARGSDSAQLTLVLSVVDAAPVPVVVLPEAATDLWGDPHRARRNSRPNAVCGTDGSPIAADAAALAGELGARLGGRLVITHAVTEPLPRGPGWSPQSTDGVSGPLRAAERSLLLSRTLAELRECPAEICFRELYGDPVEVLDGVGSAESAAFIAVGTSGIGRSRLALAGSIAASLASRATRPVLVIPVVGAPDPGRDSAERGSTPSYDS